ncbi:hypothetical protein Ahy_B03g067049 [Arachis hypogaea]|uniref:DUF4283 domain-containing protein n=1 Tax=Arachis hypogaea TaxID=3818 RepID=A0A445A5N3_ARAHY|nr:hypothetical protein Ahy_B03g067049 [Arachis hypogaea]
MTKESSAWVTRQVEDLVERSTKKVKTREHVDINKPIEDMEIVDPCKGASHGMTKVSYKESLLTPAGPNSPGDNPECDPINEDDPDQEKPFDPCPKIPVSQEEFEDWCKPWKTALIVKVLEKRVVLGFMEQRLRKDWAIKGKINVIDMDRDYFLVHFTDEADYSHALMEGP